MVKTTTHPQTLVSFMPSVTQKKKVFLDFIITSLTRPQRTSAIGCSIDISLVSNKYLIKTF